MKNKSLGSKFEKEEAFMNLKEVLLVIQDKQKVFVEGLARECSSLIYFKGIVGVDNGMLWVTKENKLLLIDPADIMLVEPVADDAELAEYPVFIHFNKDSF